MKTLLWGSIAKWRQHRKESVNLNIEKQKRPNKNNRKQAEDFPGGPVVRTSPSNARGVSSIPGQGAKSPHASGPNLPTPNMRQKQYCNKFNKDFKNVLYQTATTTTKNGPNQKIFQRKQAENKVTELQRPVGL